MKFAYSSFAYRKHSLEDTLARIAKLGYSGVEIQADRPHLFPEDYSKTDLIRIKEILKKNNLELANINAFTLCAIQDMHHPSWIEQDLKKREYRINHTIECIRFAEILGAPSISTQPGGHVEFFSREESLEIFYNGLMKVLPYAINSNVKILIEPEPDLLIEKSGEFLDFIKEINHPLIGLNCDLGHFTCVNEDPAEAVLKLQDYIGHVHIEDIKNRVHDHKILGHGDMDYKSIYVALKEIKYDGYVTVELYPYQDTPDEAGRESLEFLRKNFV